MHDAAVGQHCPDCVAEGRRTQRAPRTAFGGTASGQHGYVTKALIGINVAVAVLAVIIGGPRALAGGGWGGLLGTSTPLHEWGAMLAFGSFTDFGPAHGVAAGEVYRLVTNMFLHYGLLHVAVNMWALWVVGGVLEPLLGRARFLTLYLVSGFGGSVAVYLFAPPNVLTAGASGAVFGLFAAFFIVQRRLRRDTSAIVGILVINLILTFTIRGISIAGHLGGMVTGAVVAAALAYAPRQRRTVVQSAAIGAVVVLLVILALVRTAALT
jgi:membrane associated rhomboid family serine protease